MTQGHIMTAVLYAQAVVEGQEACASLQDAI